MARSIKENAAIYQYTPIVDDMIIQVANAFNPEDLRNKYHITLQFIVHLESKYGDNQNLRRLRLDLDRYREKVLV